jgi:hypothetical protein
MKRDPKLTLESNKKLLKSIHYIAFKLLLNVTVNNYAAPVIHKHTVFRNLLIEFLN